MGKRGAKPKFSDVFCPNRECKFYGIPGKGNIVGNGTYQIKTGKSGNISAANVTECSMIEQILFF